MLTEYRNDGAPLGSSTRSFWLALVGIRRATSLPLVDSGRPSILRTGPHHLPPAIVATVSQLLVFMGGVFAAANFYALERKASLFSGVSTKQGCGDRTALHGSALSVRPLLFISWAQHSSSLFSHHSRAVRNGAEDARAD